ncbi:MAG: capsular exopolysaccharide family [Candidatus Eremiobacteraeota bacterium]|nr:capsular exopolysaccharide family [Candidatus Eremiobacteraeota bacterium]
MHEIEKNPSDAVTRPPAEPPFARRWADGNSTATWRSFARRVARRRALFAAVFLGFVVTVLLITLLGPKRYTASMRMITGNPGTNPDTSGQSRTGLPVLNALQLPTNAQTAETYAELFRETPVAQRVIDKLRLKTDVPTLLGATQVKPVTNTTILDASVTWRDPQTAAKIANTFAAVFMQREGELVSRQATGQLEFLSKQLPAAERRLRGAEAQLSAFEVSHRIADLDAQTKSAVEAAANIDAKINAIQIEKRQAAAQAASLASQLRRMSPSTAGGGSITQNPGLAQLRSQLAQAEFQLRTAQEQFTDIHPTVIGLQRQVTQLQRQIDSTPATIVAQTITVANAAYQGLSQQLATARATAASDDAQLAVLAQQRAAIGPHLTGLTTTAAPLAELKRRQKLAEGVYSALQQKYTDAMISRTTALSDVTITQPANAAFATKTPNAVLNMIVAVIVGVVLALATVVLVDWFEGIRRGDGGAASLRLNGRADPLTLRTEQGRSDGIPLNH